MKAPRPTYANVVATLALVLAGTGTAYAAGLPRNSVGTRQLTDGAVTSTKIHTGAVARRQLAKHAIHPGAFAPGAIYPADLSARLVSFLDAHSDSRVGPAIAKAENRIDARTDTLTPIYYGDQNAAIQVVDSNQTTVGSVSFGQAGSYYMQVELRAFPTTASPYTPGHDLNCSVGGLGGQSVSINNVTVPTQAGTQEIVFGNVVTADAGSVGTLVCRQIIGTGAITVSCRMVAIRVQKG